ncbi:MAG: type III secretion system stator protein SctL, partial [Solirubrobacteraceae bacterium]|nr:type III secretion system stator protein SctL [Solirubrobacteraceae bacterium]
RIVRGPRGSSGAVIPAEVHDAHREAQRLLAEARAEGARVVASAADAREAARREGRDEGREEGLAEVTGLLVRARALAAATRAEASADLRTLAVRIAEKVLGRALAAAPELAGDLCAAALEAARHQREITLRVHPDDLAAVEAARPRLRQLLLRAPDLALRADPTVGRGGCVVETEVGAIDARLETQLAAIERALAAAPAGALAAPPAEGSR